MNKRFVISKRTARAQTQVTQDPSTQDFIDLIWSTGFKGLRNDVNLGSFYEELAMTTDACDLTRLQAGAPLLVQHQDQVCDVLGVVESATIENGIGKARVRLSQRDDLAGIIGDVKSGILRNVSVGYQVLQYEQQDNADVPTLLATKWQPQEISIVAIPFDPYAQTLRADSETNEVEIKTSSKEAEMTDQEILAQLQAKIDQGETLSDDEQQQYQDLKAKADADAKAKAEPAPEKPAAAVAPQPEAPADSGQREAELKRQAVQEFKQRSTDIKSAVRAAKLAPDFAETLIERNLSMSDASKEIFAQLETQSSKTTMAVEPTKENQAMTKREMAEQALLNRIDAKSFKVDAANPYRRARLVELFAAVVDRRTGENDANFAKRATTTASVPELLQNVANKVMGAQGAAKTTFDKWMGEVTLKDFRATPIVTLAGVKLAAKTEGGEYSQASLADSAENIQLEERGVLLVLSQKAIVNDDLSALKALPKKAQTAGAMDIESRAYALLNSNPTLADGKAFFHADHGNLIPAGALPSVGEMDAANQLLAAMTDDAGDSMDLRAKYIIVPSKYEFAAKQIASSTLVPHTAGDVNPFAGEVEVIVSSRITGNNWYVACDPADCAGFVYGTQEGISEPMVETEVDFNSSNVKTKIEYPNAVAGANHKGMIKIVVAS